MSVRSAFRDLELLNTFRYLYAVSCTRMYKAYKNNCKKKEAALSVSNARLKFLCKRQLLLFFFLGFKFL